MLSPSANRIVEVVVVVIILLVLGGLLLPEVKIGSTPGGMLRSKDNLKLLGLALHNYLAANGSFPARTICDSDGKPLLSWRVAVLPYLEDIAAGEALYQQFHLDEPWDSEHNRRLIDAMPAIFINPPVGNKAESTKTETSYLAVDGPQSVFGSDSGVNAQQITDGLSNTIMLVEADGTVPWTKPEDLNYNPADPKQGLGHLRKDGFLVLRADGGAWFILDTVDDDLLRGLMTIRGGEDVSMP